MGFNGARLSLLSWVDGNLKSHVLRPFRLSHQIFPKATKRIRFILFFLFFLRPLCRGRGLYRRGCVSPEISEIKRLSPFPLPIVCCFYENINIGTTGNFAMADLNHSYLNTFPFLSFVHPRGPIKDKIKKMNTRFRKVDLSSCVPEIHVVIRK